MDNMTDIVQFLIILFTVTCSNMIDCLLGDSNSQPHCHAHCVFSVGTCGNNLLIE